MSGFGDRDLFTDGDVPPTYRTAAAWVGEAGESARFRGGGCRPTV